MTGAYTTQYWQVVPMDSVMLCDVLGIAIDPAPSSAPRTSSQTKALEKVAGLISMGKKDIDNEHHADDNDEDGDIPGAFDRVCMEYSIAKLQTAGVGDRVKGR